MLTLEQLAKLMEEKFGEDSRIVQSLRDQAANAKYSAGAQEMYITRSVEGGRSRPKPAKSKPKLRKS